MRRKESDYREAREMLKRIEYQDQLIRKMKGEGKAYIDMTEGKTVKIYSNDKKAMEFWE